MKFKCKYLRVLKGVFRGLMLDCYAIFLSSLSARAFFGFGFGFWDFSGGWASIVTPLQSQGPTPSQFQFQVQLSSCQCEFNRCPSACGESLFLSSRGTVKGLGKVVGNSLSCQGNAAGKEHVLKKDLIGIKFGEDVGFKVEGRMSTCIITRYFVSQMFW